MSVSTHIEGPLAWVTIDNPPVNATSQAVRAGLVAAIETVEDSAARAVILRCAGRTFVAGADVIEFNRPPEAPLLPDVIRAIEQSSRPWVAAIQGNALGGGLELALGCSYRIAHKDAKLGFPEVTLGLIPGAGGSVRLPRLVACEQALDMIAGGRPVSAAHALEIGLLDRLATGVLDEAAAAYATEIAVREKPLPLLNRNVHQPLEQSQWNAALVRIRSRAGAQLAPQAAADALERVLVMSVDDALLAERESFLQLKASDQSAALRHVFFAERSVGRTTRVGGAVSLPLVRIGVIGGGTMGAGIAAACLMAGFVVTMVERDDASAVAGSKRVTAILNDAVQRGKLDACQRIRTEDAFDSVTPYEALADADLVIEAVFEDMAVKQAVLARLDKVVGKGAVLASNTSYLDLNELAQSTLHPQRVIGLHFFSPAHVMKLLEVIITDVAAPEVVATALSLGKRLGKITVPAGVCDGFIGNRIMSAYRQEADCMIEDGALPDQVDAAMREFGFPIGVFQMQDLAGLDIAWAMRKRRAASRAADERYVTIADQLCEAGRFGRKTGSGWYDYREDPNGAVDPEVSALIVAESARRGISRSSFSHSEIIKRILSVMQSEGQAIVAEGIAANPDAVDVVMINGYGFPRWRGGPMYMQRQQQRRTETSNAL